MVAPGYWAGASRQLETGFRLRRAILRPIRQVGRHVCPGMARIGVAHAIPRPAAMAAVAGIGILLSGRFDGRCIQVSHLMTLGANCRMAGQAGVAEHGLARGPGGWQAHELAAFIWPWHFRQVVSTLTCLRSVKSVVACGVEVAEEPGASSRGSLPLVAGTAAQVHQLPGHRRKQMATVESLLRTGIGAQLLIPGLAGGGTDAGRRGFAHRVLEHLAMAGQALGIGRRVDGRLEMNGDRR